MTIISQALPPHLTTKVGERHALDAVAVLASDHNLTLPVRVRTVAALGYLSIELDSAETHAAWTTAVRAGRGDVEVHGDVCGETWGWIGGHHVDLWFCSTSNAAHGAGWSVES